MKMQADDVQVTKHAMGQMAEQSAILRNQLVIAGFTGPILDQMVLAWWTSLISSALAPNLAEIMQTLLKKDEEE